MNINLNTEGASRSELNRLVNSLKNIIALIPEQYFQQEPAPEKIPHQVKHPGKILVAEDNPFNQKIVEIFLEEMGYACKIVANGQEVISALANENYSLLLLDMQMPGYGRHGSPALPA